MEVSYEDCLSIIGKIVLNRVLTRNGNDRLGAFTRSLTPAKLSNSPTHQGGGTGWGSLAWPDHGRTDKAGGLCVA